MKAIIETIIINLVDNKEEVEITEVVDGKNVTYQVKVAKTDLGKVIGKRGRIAKSIRTLLKSVGTKEQKKVLVEFIED